MLARVAHGLYALGRDVERLAGTARALEVAHAASLDGAAANGAGSAQIWEPIVAIAGDPHQFGRNHRRADARSVPWYLLLSTVNPVSVASCLSRARVQVRAVRSRLPSEVFEAISAADLALGDWTPEGLAREGVFSCCHSVRGHVAVIDGVIDRAVRRDEQWQFLRLGRHIERAGFLVRALQAHVDVRTTTASGLGDWKAMLRLASSYEAYVRVAFPGVESPDAVAFLLQDALHPASLSCCLGEVGLALDALRSHNAMPAECAPRASVLAVDRASAAAAQPGAGSEKFERLARRLSDLDEAIASIFPPDLEFAGDALFAQAVHQAQN